MKRPSIAAWGSGYLVVWADEQIQIKVARMHEKGDDTYGEITVETIRPGGGPNHLHHGRLNFTSSVGKKQLASSMKDRWNGVAWADVIEQLAMGVLREYRRGEAYEELSGDDATEPSLLLWPFLPQGEPTVLFGMGGSAKSYVGMLICLTVQLPWVNNPLGFHPAAQATNTLWLDWETSRERFNWRMALLRRGLELPYVTIGYRRCHKRLVDEIDAVREIVDEQHIGLIVVDSLFGAIGSDMNATAPAGEFFAATRMIKATWLIITHLAKGSAIQENSATPYGNVFYWNESRAVWEAKKVQETGAGSIDVGLFHRKANDTPLYNPIALRVTFDDDSTRVTRQDIAGVAELDNKRPLSDRIKDLLRDGAAKTSKDIAELLDAKEPTVRTALIRLRDRSAVVRVGDGWTLAEC